MHNQRLRPDIDAPNSRRRSRRLLIITGGFLVSAVVALGVGHLVLDANGSDFDGDSTGVLTGDAIIAGPTSVPSPDALADTEAALTATVKAQTLDLGASTGLADPNNDRTAEAASATTATEASTSTTDPDTTTDTSTPTTTATELPTTETEADTTSTTPPSTSADPDSQSPSQTQDSPTTMVLTAPAPTTGAATNRPATSAPTTQAPTTQAPSTESPVSVAGTTCDSGARFETVLFDDFNGSSLASHWTPYNSWGGFGTVDGVEGQRAPSTISVADGLLTITGYGRNGRIETGGMSNTVNLQYGRFSVRVRTDNDPSQVYSGVVLTWPQSQNQYRDGENNIFETLVKTPGRDPFFSFIHKPNGVPSQQQYYAHEADGSQWQVMTMEWTPDRITINREGPGATGFDSWVVNENSNNIIPDAPHYLAIQLDAHKSTPPTEPVRLQVDWVEIARYCG